MMWLIAKKSCNLTIYVTAIKNLRAYTKFVCYLPTKRNLSVFEIKT